MSDQTTSAAVPSGGTSRQSGGPLDRDEVAALLRALDDPSEAVRVAAWRAIVRLPLATDLWVELSRRMQSLLPFSADVYTWDDSIPRDEAIDSARFIPTMSMRLILRDLLHTSDSDERRRVAYALAAARDAAAIEPLMADLAGDDEYLSAQAGEHLMLLDTPAIESIADAFRAVFPSRVHGARMWAALLLARAGDVQGLEAVFAEMESEGEGSLDYTFIITFMLHEEPFLPGTFPERVRDHLRSIAEDETRIDWVRQTAAFLSAERSDTVEPAGYEPEPANLPELRQQALDLLARTPDITTSIWWEQSSWQHDDTLRYLPKEEASRIVSAVFDDVAHAVAADDDRPWYEPPILVGNFIVSFVGTLYDVFKPILPSLFESYRALREIEDTAGWRPLSWQLGWVVSRVSLHEVVAGMTPYLSSDVEAERLAAARLIEDAVRYAPDAYGPQFGGGAEPGDVAPVEGLIDDLPRAGALPADDETTPVTPESQKTINAWIEERHDAPDEPLVVDGEYTLSFNVGDPVAFNVFAGQDTGVAEADVPERGLMTSWTVVSDSVELRALSPDVRVRGWPAGSPDSWTARFSLLVERDRDSDVVRLGIVPRQADGARLNVLLDVGGDPWRELFVGLRVAQRAAEPVPGDIPAVQVVDEAILAPADQLGLHPPHEWQTPQGALTLRVRGSRVEVTGPVFDGGVIHDIEDESPWGGSPANVGTLITALRATAEAFRATEQTYLNDIDHADLMQRLAQFNPIYDWEFIPDMADAPHQQEWQRVASSESLRRLAAAGYALYERCFPDRTDHPVRGWLDSLPPGYRLNIKWTDDDPSWVPHMPWGLMYMRPPTLPIDPLAFMGLRFRINYVKRRIGATRHLGRPDVAYRAHCLYWGESDGDPTGAEAGYQRALWSSLAPQVILPGLPSDQDPRAAFLEMLADPQPPPMTVLYLFCQCTFDNGLPVLWFGSNENLRDTVEILMDAPRGPFADRPLVFVNACATAAATPYAVNELETYFFGRSARAFLGTETLVPIQLASRFASVFFHFFYRLVDQAPISAGEAVSQARLFLWTHYRNIGGILYTYIDQFNLYMADYDEIRTS